jgi:hypothetical protein
MSRQTLVMITAGMAQAELEVQPGGSATPKNSSAWLIGPAVGLNSMFHTTATATSEVTYGKNMAVRKNPRPRSLRFSSRARPSDAAIVSGMWPIA